MKENILLRVMAKAPLRLGLAGGGTDVDPYCSLFGGEVLSTTIARFVVVELSILDNTDHAHPQLTLEASDRSLFWSGSIDALHQPGIPGSLSLHAAVVRRVLGLDASHELIDRLRQKLIAIRLVTATDAPMGSGLGTSSTLVVAMLQAWQSALGLPWGEYEIARLAWEVERLDCGLQGGRQDQYAASFGGLIDMQFMTNGAVIVNPLPVEDAMRHELESSLVLYFTGASRESATIIADQSDRVFKGQQDAIDATHLLKEQARAMKAALLASDLQAVARALESGWKAKKRLSAAISNPEIDASYEAALEAGAYAGKVSGAGGGGFMIFLCNPIRRPQVMAALQAKGGQASTCALYAKGAQAWRSISRRAREL